MGTPRRYLAEMDLPESFAESLEDHVRLGHRGVTLARVTHVKAEARFGDVVEHGQKIIGRAARSLSSIHVLQKEAITEWSP
jgi:hypothetical protein